MIAAKLILQESTLAFPKDPLAHFNYGVFWLQRKELEPAIGQFRAAVEVDARYLPAYEALVQIYLERREPASAVVWSRRILESPGVSRMYTPLRGP